MAILIFESDFPPPLVRELEAGPLQLKLLLSSWTIRLFGGAGVGVDSRVSGGGDKESSSESSKGMIRPVGGSSIDLNGFAGIGEGGSLGDSSAGSRIILG
jgi:hypothetical protein